MKTTTVLTLALATALPLALGACGYHRIGTPATPLTEEVASKPTPTRVAPRRDEASVAASSYFPLTAGATFTYARTYAGGVPAGTRVMTVASAEAAETWVNHRIEQGEQVMALPFTSRVANANGRLTAAVPAFGNVHTLQSFSLKSPVKTGMVWDAEIDGRAWSFAARKLEKVTVPAGTYDCLVVEGLSRVSGVGTLQHVKQTLHFAPGVGLVKLKLTVDQQHETQITNQELTEELLSVK
jgi:hypothetical protein